MIYGWTSIKLPTNKVLNGNISGKEYEVKQGTNTNTAGITNDNVK